jgi:hypothetical protein
MIVAIAATCTAEAQLRIPWQAVWAVPFVVLLGLMVGAALWDRRTTNDPNRSFRMAILLSTPPVVGLATFVGFFLAAAAYATSMMLAAFYAPPALALLFMLWLAWRARKY